MKYFRRSVFSLILMAVFCFIGTAAFASGTGSVYVTITPEAAVDAGAKWSIYQDLFGWSDWYDSGQPMRGFKVGETSIKFKPVDGWATPATQAVTVAADVTALVDAEYVSDHTCLRSADPYEKWRDWQEGPARVITPELRDGNASHDLSPAEIIYYSAKENDINPVLLLAKLQDEQSLLMQGKEFSSAAGDFEQRLEKATGLGVYDSGPTLKWYGFYPQLVGSSYQWSVYKNQGLSFKQAYEIYTTGAGKYEGFTRAGGIYAGVAEKMNAVAGTAYDPRPDSDGYYGDFRDITFDDIQRLLDKYNGELSNENLFGETPISESVDYCTSYQPLPVISTGDWIPPSDGFDLPVFGDYNGNSNWYVPWDFLDYRYFYSGSYHTGEDWNLRGSNDFGAPVYSVSNGKIVTINRGAWEGITVLMIHDVEGEKFWSQYSHLEEVFVEEGQWIRRGDIIGSIGDTSGGPHLHFEMRSKEFRSNYWPVGKSRSQIEHIGYLNPTDETSPCWSGTGCGTSSDQPGFIDSHRPDPSNITDLMAEYIYEGIIHGQQADDSDDGVRVYNKYYIDSRASFIRILIQALETLAGKSLSTEDADSMPFVDVREGDWYHDDVLKAWNLGIIEYPLDGRFNPERPINRIEALSFTTRVFENYLGEIVVNVATPAFTDVTEPDDWKYPVAQKGYAVQLSSGYPTPDGRAFKPAQWVIRSESVAFVDKLIAHLNSGIPGDVNHDGCVDIHDLDMMKDAYFSDDYCPKCDIDGDERVTLLDIRKGMGLCTNTFCRPCR